MIVHDHLETPSAITLKPASTIAEMRTSARSLLSERGWSVAALERQLDHAERSKVVAAYARSEHRRRQVRLKDNEAPPTQRSLDRLLRLPELKRLTGLGRFAIYQQMQEGVLPRSVKAGPCAATWSEIAEQAWIAQRLDQKAR